PPLVPSSTLFPYTTLFRSQRPFLGICLGAQMLAKQLGAQVAPHHEGRVEVGYYPIRPTEAGHALCPDWPERVYHWHGEGFQLPQDRKSTRLNSSHVSISYA